MHHFEEAGLRRTRDDCYRSGNQHASRRSGLVPGSRPLFPFPSGFSRHNREGHALELVPHSVRSREGGREAGSQRLVLGRLGTASPCRRLDQPQLLGHRFVPGAALPATLETTGGSLSVHCLAARRVLFALRDRLLSERHDREHGQRCAGSNVAGNRRALVRGTFLSGPASLQDQGPVPSSRL